MSIICVYVFFEMGGAIPSQTRNSSCKKSFWVAICGSQEIFLLGLKDPAGFSLIQDLPGTGNPAGRLLLVNMHTDAQNNL
jgi:hypothetical protein